MTGAALDRAARAQKAALASIRHGRRHSRNRPGLRHPQGNPAQSVTTLGVSRAIIYHHLATTSL